MRLLCVLCLVFNVRSAVDDVFCGNLEFVLFFFFILVSIILSLIFHRQRLSGKLGSKMMEMKDSDESESKLKRLNVAMAELLFELSGALTFLNDTRYISDTIKVAAIPEKRGTFLKHTVYEVG